MQDSSNFVTWMLGRFDWYGCFNLGNLGSDYIGTLGMLVLGILVFGYFGIGYFGILSNLTWGASDWGILGFGILGSNHPNYD